jgi:hypothetical protein
MFIHLIILDLLVNVSKESITAIFRVNISSIARYINPDQHLNLHHVLTHLFVGGGGGGLWIAMKLGLFFAISSRPNLGPTHPPIQRIPGSLSPGI